MENFVLSTYVGKASKEKKDRTERILAFEINLNL
jgi:hypothetical protein